MSPPPPLPSRVNTKRRTTPLDGGYDRGAISERKNRRRYKKRGDNNGSTGGAAKNKKNKKRVYK